MNQICEKCLKHISNKDFLICLICKKEYHVECTNISVKLFDLMSQEGKRKWKCQSCISKAQNINQASTDNVTIRDKFQINVSVSNSFESLSDHTYDDEQEYSSITSVSKLNRSCPELSTIHDYEKIEKMEKTISNLEEKLEIAENEIGNMLLENNALKKRISEYEIQINQMKNICKSSSKITKRKKIRNINSTKLDFSQDESTIEVCSIKNQPNTNEKSVETEKKEEQNADVKENKHNQTLKRQMYILSSNNRNNITNIAEDIFSEEYRICHFKTPHIGVRQIMKSMNNKLKDFTKDDFCVLLIGEEDFKISQNYSQLVLEIRETIMGLQHTNIIICVPTYKCTDYKSIYNMRIEIFNALLYHDNLTYEYAYIMDSNLNLTYDGYMFSGRQGAINNRGIKYILRDLTHLISEIDQVEPQENISQSFTITEICNKDSQKPGTSSENENDQHNASQFFRV